MLRPGIMGMSSGSLTFPTLKGGGGREVNSCLVWRIYSNEQKLKLSLHPRKLLWYREEIVMVFDNKNDV